MVKVFARLQVWIEAAHNPAAAGSLVQIQPPQPILSSGIGFWKRLAAVDSLNKVYALAIRPQNLIQRSSVVERSAVNGKKAFLTCIRNALYIGKIQTPFAPIYQRQYQI